MTFTYIHIFLLYIRSVHVIQQFVLYLYNGYVHNSGSRSATSRKGGKTKSTRAKVNSDSDTDFQISIPLSSSAVGPSSHSINSTNGASSSYGPPHFASDHTAYSPNNHSSMSYHTSTIDNPPVFSYNNSTGDSRGYVNWPSPISSGPFLTRFNGPHSPIASLAPHSTHTLPFTTLSQSSNEDGIHNGSSMPYYYPPEWNRSDHDMPEWNRVDPPEWNRTDFMNNPSVDNGVTPSYSSMSTTNQSPETSPSLLSSWEGPLNYAGSSGSSNIVNDTSTSTVRVPSDGTSSYNNRSSTNMVDSVLFGAVSRNDDTEDARMPPSRRDSTGQRRRQGISYSSDEHQSILQELLSPLPAVSSASPYYGHIPDSQSSSNRVSTVRLDHSGRITPDVLSDDHLTRRRSARVCPGRSRLDVLQHRPLYRDEAGASSSLLESDNSPVLPLEDIAGILSDIEQNNSQSRHVATEELPTPTSRSADISQRDVITISSDEVCVCVCVCTYVCTYAYMCMCVYNDYYYLKHSSRLSKMQTLFTYMVGICT